MTFTTSAVLSSQSQPPAHIIRSAIEDVINGRKSEVIVGCELNLSEDEKSPFIGRARRLDPSELSDSTHYIKITPFSSPTADFKACSLAFCDRDFQRLEEHDYQFADQDIYKIHGKAFSILQRLVAPTFGGSKALNWIKEVTEHSKVEKLYVSDGSVASTYKCCKESSLISLKLLQIFKYGQTWYETKGAQPTLEDSHMDFETFKFLNEYLEKVFETDLFDEKYLKENYLYLLQLAQSEFRDAFGEAKNYLYELKAGELLNCFRSYQNHPILGEIFHSTQNVLDALNLPPETRIGALTQMLIESQTSNESEDLHRLRHSFLESVISYNNKFLLAYYLEKLQTPKTVKEILLSLTLSINFIECFLGYFFDLTVPYHNTVSETQEPIIDFMSFCMTATRDELKIYLEELFSKKHHKLSEKAIEKWKTQKQDFMDSFYFEHNHPENLKNMLSHIFLGPDDFDYPYFISLFFNQLKILRVSQIEKWMPSFSNRTNYLIGHKVFKPGSYLKIEDCLENIKDNPQLLKRTICGLANYMLQAAKFFPPHCLTDTKDDDSNIDRFFLAKICAFNLGPFEFKFHSDADSDGSQVW